MPPETPWGLRSGPIGWRSLGLWRPLAAVLAGLFLPSLVAIGLLALAGAPGALESTGLRAVLLLWLYALAAAPLIGWFLLPVLWPLVLILAVKGWAGLVSFIAVACVLGLALVHSALHGDLTTETPRMLPILAAALASQALVSWTMLWGLMGFRRNDSAESVR